MGGLVRLPHGGEETGRDSVSFARAVDAGGLHQTPRGTVSIEDSAHADSVGVLDTHLSVDNGGQNPNTGGSTIDRTLVHGLSLGGGVEREPCCNQHLHDAGGEGLAVLLVFGVVACHSAVLS